MQNDVPQFDRPAKARLLLADPLFVEAFETVEKAIHERWASTKIKDLDDQHELRLMLKLLKDVRENIRRVAQEGKKDLYRAKTPTYLGDLWQRRAKV